MSQSSHIKPNHKATKEGFFCSMEEKQQRQIIREKLRSHPSKGAVGGNETKQPRGPVIARPLSPSTHVHIEKTASSGSSSPLTPRAHLSGSPSPVGSGRSSPLFRPPSRGSSPPPTILGKIPPPRAMSPSFATRRTPSPQRNPSLLQLAEDVLKKRVQKALHARLFLLQRSGPHSFLIGGDSQEHKYRVTIGPQNCNCLKGPFCIHLLFVMLRVLQVDENDPLLWCRTLKNYEVEALFKKYEARNQKNLMKKAMDQVLKSPSRDVHVTDEGFMRIRREDIEAEDEDEVQCPICLLTMVDGESLVTCQNGCLNRLHHHCMAIWSKECEFQEEPLVCPLCRALWISQPDGTTYDYCASALSSQQKQTVKQLRKSRGRSACVDCNGHSASEIERDSQAADESTPVSVLDCDDGLVQALQDTHIGSSDRQDRKLQTSFQDNDSIPLQYSTKHSSPKKFCKASFSSSGSSKGAHSFKSLSVSSRRSSCDKLVSCGDCGTEEEVEALALAMEMSVTQRPLPHIPGLSPEEDEEDVIVRIQTEDDQMDQADSSGVYQENKQWIKGIHLGTGAFSTCYQAFDRKTGTIMAVKQISFMRNTRQEQEKVAAAITKEIELMASVNHPNIIRLLGATRQGCHFNMFLEWMPSGSISMVLEAYGALEENIIIKYTKQILHGLSYLHKKRVVHRDLKGANLLLDSTGHHLRIADLGTAAQMASQLTGTEEFKGQMLGTIAFMAPEILRGEKYGRSCDIWSLGCCIYEMATTQAPWLASKISNHLQLIFKIASAQGPPAMPDHTSSELNDLIQSCLKQNPEERPTSSNLLQHPVFS